MSVYESDDFRPEETPAADVPAEVPAKQAPSEENTILQVLEEGEMTLTFKKPYRFEGEVYQGIDLSGLEDLSAADIEACERRAVQRGDDSMMVNPVKESNLIYCEEIAARATGKPVEFFRQLPAREMNKIKYAVMGFMLAGD